MKNENMDKQQLLDYIKQQLQQGISREEIKNTLLVQGWQENDIDEAFGMVEQSEQSNSKNMTETTFSQNSSSPVKTSKKLIALIISAIVGVVIGGSVFGYFYYFQSPERIVQKMSEKMLEVKSLEYVGQVMAKIKTNDVSVFKQSGKFLIDFSGKLDSRNLNNPKGMFKFDINTDILPQGFGFEARTIKNVIYFRLTNAPNLGFFDLSFLRNQWIKIDPEAIKENFKLKELEEQLGKIQKEQELSLKQIEKIKRVVSHAEIFKVIKKLPKEKIDGIDTYHYEFILDKEKIMQLFMEINKIIRNKSSVEKEFQQEINEASKEIKALTGEVWIGKKDLLLHKILLKISFGKNVEEAEGVESGNVIIITQFKNYNKPMQIDIPASAKPIEEILGKLFKGLFGGGMMNFKGLIPQMPGQQLYQLPEGSVDFSKDSDNDGLADELEKIYGTDLNNPDTDGDGFKDGEEVKNGYNPKGPGKLFN